MTIDINVHSKKLSANKKEIEHLQCCTIYLKCKGNAKDLILIT